MELLFVGPIPEDGREMPTTCLSHSTEELPFEPGEYFLFVAAAEDSPPASIEFFVRRRGVDVERGEPAAEPAERLPVERRALTNHYPFMDVEALWYRDRLRQELLLEAPAELFVAVAEDVPEARIYTAPKSASDRSYRSPNEEQWPRSGEPGLLVDEDGHFLSADGLIYKIPRESLDSLENIEAVQWPDEPRTADLSLDDALSLASSDDRELLVEYERRHQQYDFCTEDYFEQLEAELSEMEADPEISEVEVDDRVDQGERAARQACNYGAVERRDRELREKLQQRRLDRRIQLLEDVRERIDDW